MGTLLSAVPCTNIMFVCTWWMRSMVGYLNIKEVFIWAFTHGNIRKIAPTGCTNAASGNVVNGESKINPFIIPAYSKWVKKVDLSEVIVTYQVPVTYVLMRHLLHYQDYVHKNKGRAIFYLYDTDRYLFDWHNFHSQDKNFHFYAYITPTLPNLIPHKHLSSYLLQTWASRWSRQSRGNQRWLHARHTE